MNPSKITITLIGLLLSIALLAQDEISFQRVSALDKALVIPSSPLASSLGQFGESKISPYNGKAQIQIGVTTISGKTLSVPINLVHDGTNPKVNVREGWAGLGWNTTSNYAITRNVIAAPDLEYNFFSMKDSLDPNIGNDQFFENRLLKRIATGEIENQLDHFYLSYPNGSVKFYVTREKEVIQKEHRNLTITPSFDFEGDITQFVVRDDNGITYEFKASEETSINIDDQFEGPIAPYYLSHQYYSAWHLTRIIGTNNIEQFFFEYETASTAHPLDINPYNSRSDTYNPAGLNNCCGSANTLVNSSVGSTNTMQVLGRKFLTEIKYVLGIDTLERVVFESSAATCTYSAPTDKKLDRIRCLKGKDGLVNIIDYDFGYDCSTGRLTLKSMQEKSANGLTFKEPYKFSYYAGTLPSLISTSIDHFGFFNNKSNGNTLIPQITLQSSSSALNSGAADRSPVESASKRATIDTIFFPTGGFTKYHWEMNRAAGLGNGVYYNYASNQNGADDRDAGGLRVQAIENYDADGALLTKRSFKYVKAGTNPANQMSSGRLLNKIFYTENTTYDNCPVMTIGGGGGDPCNTEYDCERITISANSRSTLGSIKGSHIGYSRVEQIIEANDNSGETSGKVVYSYINHLLNQFGAKDDVENGLLTKKEIYDADGKLLDKEEYVWSTQEGEGRRKIEYSSFRVVPEPIQDNKPVLCLDTMSGVFGWKVEMDDADCDQQANFPTKFIRETVNHSQRWVYQSAMTSTRYFYNPSGSSSGSISITTDYVYGDTTTNQPTETIVGNSDGKTYKSTTHFVNSYDDSEYPAANDSSATKALKRKGMTSFPLVQTQYIDNNLVYQTKLHYRQFGGKTLPSKLYESFPTKTDLLAEVFDAYDAVGNVSQGHRHYEHSSGDTLPVTMIYSNENSRMAAQVRNATLGEVAYTSFETTEQYQGGWTVPRHDTEIKFFDVAISGNGHYQPFTPSFTGETISTLKDAGTYILSYYTAPGSGGVFMLDESNVTVLSKKVSDETFHERWKYVEYKIKLDSRSSVKINITYFDTWLDELRLYPADALMNSFAYDKDNRLVLSVQDENSLTSGFEYDGLLRLTGVKNFDDHYVSLIEYLYKNQTNDHNSIKNWAVLKEGQTNDNTAKNLGTGDVVKVFSYFDGLGRDVLTSSAGTSTAENDQVGFVEYDKFGRVTKQFMPYAATDSNGGAFRSGAKGAQEIFYEGEFTGEGTHAFIETDLEFSPLNRVFKQTAQGSDFQSNPAETSYQRNVPNEVRNFHIANMWYPAESLYKTTQSDENGNQVILYTDKIGRKIMQDQEGSKSYFLYDNNGLLEQIIQPETAQKGHDAPMLDYLNPIIQQCSFLYTYDAEHRIKTKKVPNCNEYQYFYNDLDQLVMTVDGKGFRTFIKYDKLGRQVVTGRYNGNAIPTTNEVVFEERSTSAPHYYTTTQSFPADGMIDVYTTTYYDDYDFNNDDTEDVSYQATTGYDSNDYNFVRGKATASKVAILESDGSTPNSYLNHYFFFDKFQRVLQIRKDNHLAGTDVFWHKYNFVGWLLNSRREHSTTINGNTQNININERYEYDHVGRDIAYYHQIEGQDEKQVCEKSYNEREELAVKKIGKTSGGSFLQTVDYSYNIRRWLTGMNNTTNLGNDLFAMNLVYNNPFATNDNFNGNVTSIAWRNNDGGKTKHYDFNYDKLNRLTDATYRQELPDATSSFVNNNDRFNTSYTYDLNGNIETLNRNGLLPNGTYGEVDNLNYAYADNGSLNRITENSNVDAGFKSAPIENGEFYIYDDNGNVTYDDHKGISTTYNFLNQPESIIQQDANLNEIGSIEWRHDAVGNKLSKLVTTNHLDINLNPIVSKEYRAAETITSDGTVVENSEVTFTAGESIILQAGFTAKPNFLARIASGMPMEMREYVGGIEYVNEKIESVYFADGRVKYEGNNTEYEYVLKDNQGNTRSLFKEGAGSIAESIEDYSYYPLGALHSQASELNQKYLQTGKELQTELDLGWSDFKVRCFDNWSGKWQGVDILADYNAGTSPYTFASANPVRFSDPSGMISEDENGLMQVSTDLWGGGRNQSFMNQSASQATSQAQTTQNRQAGYVEASPNAKLTESQFKRDIVDSYKFVFNKHAGEEVSREEVENGVDITFSGAFEPNKMFEPAFANPIAFIDAAAANGADKLSQYVLGRGLSGLNSNVYGGAMSQRQINSLKFRTPVGTFRGQNVLNLSKTFTYIGNGAAAFGYLSVINNAFQGNASGTRTAIDAAVVTYGWKGGVHGAAFSIGYGVLGPWVVSQEGYQNFKHHHVLKTHGGRDGLITTDY